MKNILILCTITLLMGCAGSAPLKPKFPKPPATLMEPCEPLTTIKTPTILLSDFVKIVSENYTKHHECVVKYNAWQEWYTEQEKLYNSIK